MTDFLLNECGDLDYTEGKLTIVTGVDAIRQRWLIYIRTFLGEWFLNTTIGVPYFQQVLKKAVSRQVIKQVFTTASLEVPGVIQVVSVIVDSLNVATRFAEVTVTCIVSTEEGPETGVFKFTGTIPPEDCTIAPIAPETLAQGDEWFWFDPSDLDSFALPYVAGAAGFISNKYETQPGVVTFAGIPTNPRVLPVMNGRKCVQLDTATQGFSTEAFTPGPTEAEVRALRQSLGSPSDAPFTIFGVYQAIAPPAEFGDPLITIAGIDADGTTIRWINILIARDAGAGELSLAFIQDDATTPAGGYLVTATGVDSQSVFAYALTYRESGTTPGATETEFWVNGVSLGQTEFNNSGFLLQQLGQISWNSQIDDSGGAGPGDFNNSLKVGEQLGISRHMSDADVIAMSDYLMEKWGI